MRNSSIRRTIVLLVVAAAQQAAAQSLIVNGSFEEGPPVRSFVNLGGGATSIPGWTVTGEGVDYVGSYWKSAAGSRAIDLDGSARSRQTPPHPNGGIAQTFATIPGTRYRVTFAMAGNPNRPPALKPMRLTAAGQETELVFDCTGKTGREMGWRREEWTFTARESSTTLEFFSLTASPLTGYGPAIDDVAVEAIGGPVEVVENEREIRVALGSEVLFDTGRHTLKPEATDALEALAGVIEAHPELPVRIEGHTDSVGIDEANQSLSQRRALSVRDWLVARGTLPAEAMTVAGFGESAPVASNETAEGRRRNRRVEVKLLKP